jgi:hypothetical protein
MKNTRGFISLKTIAIAVLIILAVSFFGIDLKKLAQNPTTQSNFNYVWSGVSFVWESYLRTPLSFVWNNVFIDLIWEPSYDALTQLKNGEGESLFQSMAPKIDFD